MIQIFAQTFNQSTGTPTPKEVYFFNDRKNDKCIYIFSFDYRTCFQLKQDSTKGKVFIKPNRKSSKGQAHHMFLQILNLHFFHEFKVLQNVF